MEPSAQPESDRCRCGHLRADHQHYRSGTDCSVCGPAVCDRYRSDRSRLRRWAGGVLDRAARVARLTGRS